MKSNIFIIVPKDCIESTQDIFVTKADSIDDALTIYSKEFYSKLDYFIYNLEQKSIDLPFWGQFFKYIYYNDNDEEIETDLNNDEIKERFEKNIENYLGEDGKTFTSDLINFYNDWEKEITSLPEELIYYLALKELKGEIDNFVIKEVIITHD